MFEAEALARTCIRAQGKDGKWGSFTFRELLDQGLGSEIIKWFGDSMLGAAGVEPDGKVSEDAAVNMARIREIIVGPLVKIKKDVPGVSP